MTAAQASDVAVSAAVRATYTAFISSGFAFASWASRIPQVRSQLHLDSAKLGLLLLCIAVGSMLSLPAAGAIVHRFQSRRTVGAMAVLFAAGMVTAAIGYLIGVVPVAVGLFVLGFANGAWDVAMNVQGATVERCFGRAIMPRFHAGFSVGTVTGALLGAVMVAIRVPVTAHLLGVALIVGIGVPIAVRQFLPDSAGAAEEVESAAWSAGDADMQYSSPARRNMFARWREPRTILIGVFVLAFAFAEGAGNDWINVSLIDGYHASAVVGTLGFAAFLAAMTTARWFGPASLDRFGRVRVVRAIACIGIVGVLVFVFSPHVGLTLVGAILWGTGVSLGFPVGMSAAADEPAAAAVRVSVVASIGYCAFLAGPPLIGFVGQHATVLKALTSVAVLLALAFMLAGATRPLRPATEGEGGCTAPPD
jgi:MFS family permease